MKYLYALLLAAFALTTHAQIVIQSAGAANVPVNWSPSPEPSTGPFPGVYTRFVDSLAVDVTGDGRADVVFDYTYEYRPQSSVPLTTRYFSAHSSRGSGLEIAYDNAGFTPLAGIRRYVAGDVIDPSLQWSSSGTLWSNTSGNGGSSTTGFFYGTAGFILVRKNMGSQLRYWWFYLGNPSHVAYYAGASAPLMAKAATAVEPIIAFPNPATDRLSLSRPATYELFDCQGRRLRSGLTIPTGTIEVESLPSGIYQLVTYGPDGLPTRQRIVHP
jgi:hypothetical protein